MVRFDPERPAETAWTDPDRFEIKAKQGSPVKDGKVH
jgi:hypothetical protein